MTTYASEPGTKLGGRYRLEDRIAAGAGWDAWKAIDETLARAVTVFTFASGFPRIGDVVTAARAASRLTDPRLAQVFDVEDDWDHAYIVMEWAAGDTLGDLLAQGPLEPYRAARMMAEAAGALSSAHAAGVAHMCLSPGSVRWSPTGEVKVVGLGIDAALSGIVADEPVRADTEGLGWLLYAALTGCWPGPEYPAMPPAPIAGGEPRSPRQVIAGIPPTLSDITCRAMHLRSAGDNPLPSPGDMARALVATLPPTPLLAIAEPPSWRGHAEQTRGQGPARRAGEDSWERGDQTGPESWQAGPQGGGYADTDWPPGGHGSREPQPRRRRQAKPVRRAPHPGLACLAAGAVLQGRSDRDRRARRGRHYHSLHAVAAIRLAERPPESWPEHTADLGDPASAAQSPGLRPADQPVSRSDERGKPGRQVRHRQQHADRLELAVVRQRRVRTARRPARA